MKAKKLHTDECYFCIISFIRSVLALALMSWPWGMRPYGHGFGLDSAAFVNITDLTISSAAWIQYTNVTDGRTQGDRKDRRLYLRIASRGKKITPTVFWNYNALLHFDTQCHEGDAILLMP